MPSNDDNFQRLLSSSKEIRNIAIKLYDSNNLGEVMQILKKFGEQINYTAVRDLLLLTPNASDVRLYRLSFRIDDQFGIIQIKDVGLTMARDLKVYRAANNIEVWFNR